MSAANNKRLIGDAIIQNIFETINKHHPPIMTAPLHGKGGGLSQDARHASPSRFQPKGW